MNPFRRGKNEVEDPPFWPWLVDFVAAGSLWAVGFVLLYLLSHVLLALYGE